MVTPLNAPGRPPRDDSLMRADAMAEVIGLPEERIRGLRLSEIGTRAESEELEQHLREVPPTSR